MKGRLILVRKALLGFLLFVGLFGYDSCRLVFAFSSTSGVIKAMRDSEQAERAATAITPCKGVSSYHTTKKVVALTFDDGPNRKYTEQVLEVLRLNNIKGTFFAIGKNAEEYPQIVQEAYRDGHIIGNHTYSHHYLNLLGEEQIEAELTKTSTAINRIIGVRPLLFRPPYGACSAKSVRVAKDLNYKTIMWSSTGQDFRVGKTTPEKISSEILNLIRPGSIVVMHDGGGNREKTVEALQIIIGVLKSEGYEFVTVPQLLGIQAYEVACAAQKPDRKENIASQAYSQRPDNKYSERYAKASFLNGQNMGNDGDSSSQAITGFNKAG